MIMSLQTINEAHYRELIKNKGVAVIEFGADWCGPCRMLAPILSDIDNEYGPSVTVAKVDVDHSPQLASEFGIMGVPTVVLFKDGQPIDKLVGLRPKAAYKSVIDRLLN